MSNLDRAIRSGWTRSFENYVQSKSGIAIEGETRDQNLGSVEHELPEQVSVNVSEQIPMLQRLIDESDNKEELETEVKNIVMKFYWNGFYSGFQAGEDHSSEK